MPPSSPFRRIPGDDPLQEDLNLDPPRSLLTEESIAVLDLFAGIGGLSAGFAERGFEVTGVDSEELAGTVYRSAGFGSAHLVNLATELCVMDVPVVIGGPPCRPWSAMNLQRRQGAHDDHALLTRFIENVRAIRPAVFVMENVPAVRSDALYIAGTTLLRADGYDVAAQILHYDHFGAATRRRRLFTVGVHGSQTGSRTFFDYLQAEQLPPSTVGNAIRRFRDIERGAMPDHDWSELQSIGNYRDRYTSGQFGWRKLAYDSPAPSFGSVAKTYILHPEAGDDGFPERVLSVREVMAIMGFADNVRFPAGAARAKRYQMVANTVSPQVSGAVASAVWRLLMGRKS
jgi:DNA (cytosine-5)-methyltransferase 1